MGKEHLILTVGDVVQVGTPWRVEKPPGWPEALRAPIWVAQADGGMWMVETEDSRPYVSASRSYGVWCVDWADFGVVAQVVYLATHYPEGA